MTMRRARVKGVQEPQLRSGGANLAPLCLSELEWGSCPFHYASAIFQSPLRARVEDHVPLQYVDQVVSRLCKQPRVPALIYNRHEHEPEDLTIHLLSWGRL